MTVKRLPVKWYLDGSRAVMTAKHILSRVRSSFLTLVLVGHLT